MSLYILIHHNVTMYICVIHFYDLSALVGCWSSVSIRRIIYEFSNVCPFYYTAVAVSGKVVRAWIGLTTPVRLTAVTPIDRHKSVRNCCVIEVLVAFLYVVTMLFGFFCGWRGFCHRTESDFFPFLLEPLLRLSYSNYEKKLANDSTV